MQEQIDKFIASMLAQYPSKTKENLFYYICNDTFSLDALHEYGEWRKSVIECGSHHGTRKDLTLIAKELSTLPTGKYYLFDVGVPPVEVYVNAP